MASPAFSAKRPTSSLARDLLDSQERMLLHEQPENQAAALRVIPDKVINGSTERSEDEASVDDRDRLLYRLQVWFKDEFFTWFEPKLCSACGTQLVIKGRRAISPVNPVELAYTAEMFGCDQCGGPCQMEFPRYNHPKKLLETRVGRCGEWANCFALCCRAVGLEARSVQDSLDHVWTEVYSENERRWLHADTGENGLDNPLLYEAGWGKKLAYVFAFSASEVSDVTFRYSRDHGITIQRRRTYSEPHLARTLVEVNNWLQRDLPEPRRRQLAEHRIAELAQLLRPPADPSKPMRGRQSGSLAWRLARGEISAWAAEEEAEAEASAGAGGFVFRPTAEERDARQLRWSYSPIENSYCRGESRTARWQSCVYAAADVQRKVERDWRRVYLCRHEYPASASLSWRCELDDGLRVDGVTVTCRADEFYSGRVRWTLSGDCGAAVALRADGTEERVTGLAGSSEVTLAAEMDGGDGDCAFQHAQLLRTSLKGPDQPLQVTITMQGSDDKRGQ